MARITLQIPGFGTYKADVTFQGGTEAFQRPGTPEQRKAVDYLTKMVREAILLAPEGTRHDVSFDMSGVTDASGNVHEGWESEAEKTKGWWQTFKDTAGLGCSKVFKCCKYPPKPPTFSETEEAVYATRALPPPPPPPSGVSASNPWKPMPISLSSQPPSRERSSSNDNPDSPRDTDSLLGPVPVVSDDLATSAIELTTIATAKPVSSAASGGGVAPNHSTPPSPTVRTRLLPSSRGRSPSASPDKSAAADPASRRRQHNSNRFARGWEFQPS